MKLSLHLLKALNLLRKSMVKIFLSFFGIFDIALQLFNLFIELFLRRSILGFSLLQLFDLFF